MSQDTNQYREAPISLPIPLSNGEPNMDILRSAIKTWNDSLVQSLLSHNATKVYNHSKEARYLIDVDKGEGIWNKHKVQDQPASILRDILTMIDNREEIILDDPNLLK